jgi:hypothetical protein
MIAKKKNHIEQNHLIKLQLKIVIIKVAKREMDGQ